MKDVLKTLGIPLLIFLLFFSISLSYTYISPSFIKVSKILDMENENYFLDPTGNPAIKVFGSIITEKDINTTSGRICIGNDCISSWNSLSGIPSGYCIYITNSSCPTGFTLKSNLTNTTLQGFPYRKPYIIKENNGTDLINYILYLTLDTQSLISSGKLKSDCSDLRITYYNPSDNQEHLLSYDPVNCNSPSTQIYTVLPLLPSNSERTLYVYYGNPSAEPKNTSVTPYVFLYGGSNYDYLPSIYSDGTYLYTVGYTYSEGSGGYDALILKLDKNLNLISKKLYGGSSGDGLSFIYSDGSYLYVVGWVSSEGSGSSDALILKLDKDLNLISKKIYGGSNYEYLFSIYSDGTYLYVVGRTESEGSGNSDALILKLDKNLNLISKKLYGGSSDDRLYSIYSDGTYLYAVGYTESEGSGYSDALILKLDKDLNLISKKIYGGSNYEYLFSIYSDGTYLYVVGRTESEGSGNSDALILKLDKNLNLISKKLYGGSSDDNFFSIYSDGTYLYTVGYTYSEGSGDRDALILKLDKNLNLISKKIYGGSSSDSLSSIYSDGTYLYAVGYTESEGSGYSDALILKLSQFSLKNPYNMTTPTQKSVLAPSNLNYQDSNLNYQDSSLTYQDSALTYQDSSLTYQDSNLTTYLYELQTVPVPQNKPTILDFEEEPILETYKLICCKE